MTYRSDIRPHLVRLCGECHGPHEPKADLNLAALDSDFVNGPDAETWHDVLNRLNLGEMPPAKSPQPTDAERRVLVDWLTAGIRRAASAKRQGAGRVVTRRLTRYEYRNTMRDLLGADLEYDRELPPEPASADGFLNDGATLEMSPLQVESALRAARRGLKVAIVDGDRPEVFRYEATETAVGKLPNRKVDGHEPVRPEFILDLPKHPREGGFRLTLRAAASIPEGAAPPRMRIAIGFVPGIVHVPRKLVGEVEVTGALDDPAEFTFHGRIEDFPQPGDRPFGNTDFDGMIVLVDFVDADGNELRYDGRKYATPPPGKKKGPPIPAETEGSEWSPEHRLDVFVMSAEFESPAFASWPPASHVRLLPPREEGESEPAHVRRVLRSFVGRAFRRPARDDEVERYAAFFAAIQPETPTFEEAIRETFAAVLVSPHFLYRVEPREAAVEPRSLTDHELASRLSYFLWSTMPDDRLFQLAEQGTLHEPETLRGEVERMLADDRSREFVERFADQWFGLDALDRVAVNPEFHPGFDERLKNDMRNETRAVLAEMVRENGSALDLVDSDWTMLNRRLARHYGITGPETDRFERVALPEDARRGGVLGHGAFLLGNSDGADSHPIKRAVWILDRLLDAPPASPPPDVPELDPTNPDLAGLSLKEKLAVHRAKPACANCHRGIDPWGVPLESFDAIGRWRTEVARPKKGKRPGNPIPVDASSVLPDETAIDGPVALRRHLLQHRRDDFARAVVKRLATYGLGRSLDLGDEESIGVLTEQFAANDYRLRDLITEFIGSDLFHTK